MNKDVLITISGHQIEYVDVEANEHEAIEVVNPATYFFKDGLHYVFFEEMQEGTANITKNKIVYKEGEYLEVVKKGETNSTMRFEVGKDYESAYETPFGEMLLGVTTREVRTTKTGESLIVITASYDLAVNCESYAACEIIMKISDMNQGM